MNPLKSVRFRITFWHAFLLTVLLLVITWFMYAQFSALVRIGTDSELSREADAFTDSIADEFEGAFSRSALEDLSQMTLNSKDYPTDILSTLMEVVSRWESEYQRVRRSAYMVRLLALDDSILLSNLKNWQNDIIFPYYERDSAFMERGKSYLTIHFEKKPIRLYYFLFRYQTRPLFIIQVGKSMVEQETALNQLLFVLMASIPFLILLACGFSWFLVNRSFAPMVSMVKRAREISSEQMSRRLPRTHSGDDLDQLAETLNQMIDRIEISNKTIKEFSSNVSHELKTPLAIIRGEIDLAWRKARSEDSLRETLKIVDGEVNELIRLVEDLNILVKSDAREFKLDLKRVDLRDILKQIVELFQERARKKSITVQFVGDKDCPVTADPVYLKRLFMNLIDNAIKFTDANGHVVVHLDPGTEEACVKVVDDGMGIEPELKEKIFVRFFRTDHARSQEGAGLGLSIVKAICKAHRGRIHVDSELGRGTSISVFLPFG